MSKYYDALLEELKTFKEVFPSFTDFKTVIDQLPEPFGWPNVPLIEEITKYFLYWVLRFSFEDDLIAYQDETRFKARIKETFHSEIYLLQKKYQIILKQYLSEDALDSLYRNAREYVSSVNATSLTDVSGSASDTSLTKNADTPTKVYGSPQQFVDQFTNAMSQVAGSNTNTQTSENEATSSVSESERVGTKELFKVFENFPRSVYDEFARPFAKHFVSIYFE